MRDAHHPGRYGFTILAQFKVGEADDHGNGDRQPGFPCSYLSYDTVSARGVMSTRPGG
jgi:hypothetical protein